MPARLVRPFASTCYLGREQQSDETGNEIACMG